MKLASLKLKQKNLLVILLIIAIVMVASSAVVSYVIYNQNISTANENLSIAISNIKNELEAMDQDLILKTRRMISQNKIGETVKFIHDFRDSFALGMTETSFLDLANAAYTNASSNGIQQIAIYDRNGNLASFAEIKKDQNILVGYHYVNPKEAYNFTYAQENVDIKKNSWETQEQIDELSSQLVYQDTMLESEVARLVIHKGKLTQFVSIPVMSEKYNDETEQMDPLQIGFVILYKELDKQFISEMSKLTGLDVSVFSGTSLSAGSLDDYTELNADGINMKLDAPWDMKTQAAVLNNALVNGKDFLQGILPVFDSSGYIGAVSVLKSNETVVSNTLQIVYVLLVVYACCILFIIPIALFFSKAMVKTILQVSESLKDVAEGDGDLTKRIDIKSKDEIGDLSHWFNIFIEKLQKMITEISKNSHVLNNSAADTRKLSDHMAGQSNSMLDKSNTVAAAAEEMSTNVSTMTSTVDQASNNLEIVAASTEEMTATINEISKNAASARNISVETSSQIENASEQVNQLGHVAEEIDNFTEIITDISEQTNLLPLIEPIEQPKAGGAGKGFAVVANEIKELARQTADATKDIREKINNIKHSASGTASEIKNITSSFNDVNEIVTSIATAVEEQSVTTKEIAENITSVSGGISEVNQNIAQFDVTTNEITQDISDVNNANTDLSDSCSKVQSGSEKMSDNTQTLEKLVKQFIIE